MGVTVLACRVRTHGERGTAVGSGLIRAGAQGKIEAGDPGSDFVVGRVGAAV